MRYDVLVVGTNAFAAYEMVCGARFPVGNEATEDFDLAWCRGTRVSLAAIAPPAPQQAASGRASLMSVLKRIDSTYALNRRKPYQAVNDAGYEVELLAAPSTHPLPKSEAFEPMATLVEQEWLLRGTPVRCVVTTNKPASCPRHCETCSSHGPSSPASIQRTHLPDQQQNHDCQTAAR